MNKFISKYLFYYPTTLINGENVYKSLNTAISFQRKMASEINNYQIEHINRLIKYAKINSPHYQLSLKHIDSYEDFHKAPFLTKKELIKNFPSICTKNASKCSMKTTGGSTGQPVRIYKNPEALAQERGVTWRCYRWANIDIGDKQARFWGVPHSTSNRFKAKLIDFIANRKRLSAFDLTPSKLKHHYHDLQKFKPNYLYGYVSVIKAFSAYIKENNLPPLPSVRSIITTSEVLSQGDREFIEKVWNKKIYNEYGCGEVGSIAHECEHGNMHITADNLYVEIIDDDGNPSDQGEIVVTDFFNQATPLIRYRLGDYASWSKENCPCGRQLPILKGIHGRAYDIIRCTNGKNVHPEAVIYIFEEIQNKEPVFDQFQVIQSSKNTLDIYICNRPNFDLKHEVIIKDAIATHIDDQFCIKIHLVNELHREASGKMRIVKSLL